MKRNLPIDALRGFCMFAVVMGHSIRYIEGIHPIFVYIYSFNVGMFFIISGYVFKVKENESCLDFIRKKFTTILLPYFGVGVISAFIYKILIKRKSSLLTMFKGLLIASGKTLDFNAPLWFLPAIFVMSVFFYFFHRLWTKATKKDVPPWIVPILFGASFLIYQFTKIKGFIAPWGVSTVIFAGWYFELGYQWKKHDHIISEFINKNKVYLSLLVLCGFVLSKLNGKVSVRDIKAGNSYLLWTVSVLCTTIGLYCIMVMLCEKTKHIKNAIVYIGVNTMPILLYHKLIISVYRRFFHVDDVMNQYVQSPVLLFAIFAAVVTLNICCCIIAGRIQDGVLSAIRRKV